MHTKINNSRYVLQYSTYFKINLTTLKILSFYWGYKSSVNVSRNFKNNKVTQT